MSSLVNTNRASYNRPCIHIGRRNRVATDNQVATINSMIALLKDARDTTQSSHFAYNVSETFRRARTMLAGMQK